MTVTEGSDIAVFVIGLVLLPAAEDDALPLVGEGALGLMGAPAAFELEGVEGTGPAAVRNGAAGKLMEGLSQVGWTVPPPLREVHLAAADGDRSDAAEALDLGRGFEAAAIGAERDVESWSELRTGARERSEQRGIGLLRE